MKTTSYTKDGKTVTMTRYHGSRKVEVNWYGEQQQVVSLGTAKWLVAELKSSGYK